MNITVTVQTNSSQEKVEEISAGDFKVYVHAQPIEGRANDMIIKLLAKHFKVGRSVICLVRGTRSKHKVFSIDS